GDMGFGRVNCRCRQILMDKEETIRKENCSFAAMKPTSTSCASSSTKSTSSTSASRHRKSTRNRAGDEMRGQQDLIKMLDSYHHRLHTKRTPSVDRK
ncbi:unnamed protein product, partial [Dovyalis caffra]